MLRDRTEEELATLSSPALASAARSQRAWAEATAERVARRAGASVEEADWAERVVRTRAIRDSAPDGSAALRLVPLLDLANHRGGAGGGADPIVRTGDGVVALCATEDLVAGDEVTFCYRVGIGADELLLDYGFGGEEEGAGEGAGAEAEAEAEAATTGAEAGGGEGGGGGGAAEGGEAAERSEEARSEEEHAREVASGRARFGLGGERGGGGSGDGGEEDGGRYSGGFRTHDAGVGNAGPEEASLRGGHLVHATEAPLLSAEQCASLVEEAAAAMAAGSSSSFTYTRNERLGERVACTSGPSTSPRARARLSQPPRRLRHRRGARARLAAGDGAAPRARARVRAWWVNPNDLPQAREWLRAELRRSLFPLLAERFGADAAAGGGGFRAEARFAAGSPPLRFPELSWNPPGAVSRSSRCTTRS